MITETGKIVAIETDCLWVETVRQSTCGGCALQKGCGHGLLNQIGAGRRNYLRVLYNNQHASCFTVGDQVDIAIPEKVLIQSALLMYIVPLLGLLAGALLASWWWPADSASFIGSLLGFVAGLGLVKYRSQANCNNRELQPTVLPRKPGAASSQSVNLH